MIYNSNGNNTPYQIGGNAKVQKELKELQEAINLVDSNFNNYVDSNNADITRIDNNISAIDGSVSNINSRLSTAEGKIAGYATNVQTVNVQAQNADFHKVVAGKYVFQNGTTITGTNICKIADGSVVYATDGTNAILIDYTNKDAWVAKAKTSGANTFRIYSNGVLTFTASANWSVFVLGNDFTTNDFSVPSETPIDIVTGVTIGGTLYAALARNYDFDNITVTAATINYAIVDTITSNAINTVAIHSNNATIGDANVTNETVDNLINSKRNIQDEVNGKISIDNHPTNTRVYIGVRKFTGKYNLKLNHTINGVVQTLFTATIIWNGDYPIVQYWEYDDNEPVDYLYEIVLTDDALYFVTQGAGNLYYSYDAMGGASAPTSSEYPNIPYQQSDIKVEYITAYENRTVFFGDHTELTGVDILGGLEMDSLNVQQLVAQNAVIHNGEASFSNANAVNGNIDRLSTNHAIINSGEASFSNLAATNANIDNLNVNNAIINGGEATFGNASIDNLVVNNTAIDNLVANNVTFNNASGSFDNATFNNASGTFNNVEVQNLIVNDTLNVLGNNFYHQGLNVISGTVIPEDEYNNLALTDSKYQTFYLTSPNGNMYFCGIQYKPQIVPEISYVAYFDIPNFAYNIQNEVYQRLEFTTDPVTNSILYYEKYNGILEISPFYGRVWNNSAPVGTIANSRVSNNLIKTNATELYIKDAGAAFHDCYNMVDCFLTNPSLVINAKPGYDPMKSITNLSYTFINCYNFNPQIPLEFSNVDLFGTFYYCRNLNVPITIDSPTAVRTAFYGCANLYGPVRINNATYLNATFAGANKVNAILTNCDNASNLFGVPASSYTSFNGSLITDNVRNLSYAFGNCVLFNNSVVIGNGAENISGTFYNCQNFNQSLTIPDSVTDMGSTFARCYNFNNTVTIGNGVINMANTFSECRNFNQPITIPDSVTDMGSTFASCSNFNQPITIPDSVTNMANTFLDCSLFDQQVTIPNVVTDLSYTFYNCSSFNQPVTIPEGVTNIGGTFYNCSNFNQPITISENVTNMSSTFSHCVNFNQPVTIPEGVTNMYRTFYECTILSASTVPIHISHNISLGDTTNYIYNGLVNGYAGIRFDPSRILNDA